MKTEESNSFRNYMMFKKFDLFYNHFIFADTDQYLADNIFIKNKLPVKFGKELRKVNEDFIFICCKVKKSDTMKFLNSMDELKTKMLLFGKVNYQKFCDEYLGML